MAKRMFQNTESDLAPNTLNSAKQKEAQLILKNDDYQSIVIKHLECLVGITYVGADITAGVYGYGTGWLGFAHVSDQVTGNEVDDLEETSRYILRDRPFTYMANKTYAPVLMVPLHIRSVTLRQGDQLYFISRLERTNIAGSNTIVTVPSMKYAIEYQGRLN